MKFGSLFSGIGGMDLGLERAGMECAWQVEIDDYCQRVLNKHWPDVPKFGEVRDVGKGNLETVDLIAGGFPCQPHSVAGKRKGAADDRNLWPEFSRIIAELQPRYVIAENVPGIITTYIDTVLSDLEGEGYTCTTFNIPAIAFDAPHRRERIFIVAYANGKRRRYPQKRQDSISESISANQSSKGWRRTNVADALSSDGRRGAVAGQGYRQRRQLAKAKRTGLQPGYGEAHSSESQSSGEVVADPESPGHRNDSPYKWAPDREINSSDNTNPSSREQNWWSVESNVGRVAHGIPSRVDRLRGLGNAVVPQVAEWIGKRIMEFDGTP